MASALKELGAEFPVIVTGLDVSARRRSADRAWGFGLAITRKSPRSPYLAEGLEALTPLGHSRAGITAHATSAAASQRGKSRLMLQGHNRGPKGPPDADRLGQGRHGQDFSRHQSGASLEL